MAIMVPESCPSTATAGERRLYTILSRLPISFRCWYEPIVQRRYPDFMLLGPDFGLIVIEVKGWHLDQLRSANDHEIELLPRA